MDKLRVVKSDKSPSGYWIYSGGGAGVPATTFEVRLWKMYVEAVDLALKLKEELNTLAEERIKSQKK